MKTIMRFILLPLVLLSTFSLSASAEENIEAIITSYECGDNCYLEIIDSEDAERIGLCTASLCEAWNEEALMPDEFIGKKVLITLGQAQQYDAEGNVMGTMEAFTHIEVLAE